MSGSPRLHLLLATQAPFPVSRGLAIALAAAGPVAVGGILAARAHDASPMLAAPAIVFGVVAATGPALYIATAAAGNAPPLAAVIRAFGLALGAFGLDGPPEGAERPVPRLLRGSAPLHTAGPPKPLDPTSRCEVQAALAGRYGAATRLWDKQGRVYLFSALPIRHAGQVDGVVYVTRSTHDVKLQLYHLRTWLFRLLIATLGLTALVTLVLATTIARPLGRLTRRAQRIAARLPAEADQLAERSDEIGQLARAVAAMTDELERRAHDARTLAADISHEFKTPLTGIRGAAELLRDGASDDPLARDRFLAMILDDAARSQSSRMLDPGRHQKASTAAGRTCHRGACPS